MIRKVFDGEIKLLSLDVLAKQFGIHIVTIRRYVRQGKLKARKIGRSYYVSKESVNDFINCKKIT